MDIYLVGGAVRDRLLGLPVRERDWVVIGATPADMLALGYTPVGKEFPVFLHPETKEEYALARTERKTAPGYTGFAVSASPDITLEEDLLRRDLTINAMAETAAGELIDPYGGETDLAQGVLRHVSPAFSEDPVRILRMARFAARFARAGFHVAHATNALMRSMVQAGEVDHLVPERVWAELVKTLETDTPARFFAVLAGCGALPILFPELMPLAGNSDASEHGHGNPGLPVLDQAVALGGNTAVRFAALVCDIDNGTPGGFSETALDAFCKRHHVPNACSDLAVMSLLQRQHIQAATTLTAAGLLGLLNTLDAFRREARCHDFLKVCESDARACRYDFNGNYLLKALAAARSVNTSGLQQQGLSGREIGEALDTLRIQAIDRAVLQAPAG